MNRRVTIALAALAGLTATVSMATATEVQWPTGGGDTNWIGIETAPAITPDGGLAIVRRVSGNNDNLVRLDSSGWIRSTGPNLTFATNAPSGGVTADAAGNIYMSSDNSNVYSRVVKISPDNAATAVWQQSPVDRYVGDPILIDGRGRLVFTSVDDSGPQYVTTLIRVNADGTGAEEFRPNPPTDDVHAAVDQAGNAFMAIWGAGADPARVMKVSADGVVSQVATLPNPNPLAIAAGPYETLHVAYADGTLSRVSAQGVVTPVGGVTLSCPAARSPLLDAGGVLYLTAQCGGGNPVTQVYAISANGTVTTVSTFSGEFPQGTVLDGLGNLYAALQTVSGASRIVRISSGGGAPEIAPAPPAVPPAPTATAGDRVATVTLARAAANAQYGTPTSYEVSSVEDPSKSCTITLPATSCTVTGLTGGTRYTFVAKARLLSWLTPASAASDAVVPTAPAPTPTPPAPARLGASVKCSGVRCVTTGRLPAGAARVTQSATTGSRANAVPEIFARRSVKGTCTLSPAKVKGRKVKKRTYTCRIKLAKGTWTVTTSALAGSRTLATSSRKVTVRR